MSRSDSAGPPQERPGNRPGRSLRVPPGRRRWRQRPGLADVGRNSRSEHGLREPRPTPFRMGREQRPQRALGGGARFADLREPGGGGRPDLRRHQQRGSLRPGGRGRQGNPPRLRRRDGRVPLANGFGQARLRPGERLAVPGDLLVAARGGGPPLLRDEPGRTAGPRCPWHGRRQRRTGDRRSAPVPDRRRRHLAARHDGGARLLPPQHVELEPGRPREPHLREHLERPRREPREPSFAVRPRDHRGGQGDRRARLGGEPGRGEHPARAVVRRRGGPRWAA